MDTNATIEVLLETCLFWSVRPKVMRRPTAAKIAQLEGNSRSERTSARKERKSLLKDVTRKRLVKTLQAGKVLACAGMISIKCGNQRVL
jgi:hypothetical protein